jgi:hypothetical protein
MSLKTRSFLDWCSFNFYERQQNALIPEFRPEELFERFNPPPSAAVHHEGQFRGAEADLHTRRSAE